MRVVREHRRIQLRFAAELLDALRDLVRMLLLFLGVLEKLRLHRLRVNPRRHEVVKFVPQHAHELRRERLVQDGDGLLAIETIVLRHGAVGDVLPCAIAKLLDL